MVRYSLRHFLWSSDYWDGDEFEVLPPLTKTVDGLTINYDDGAAEELLGEQFRPASGPLKDSGGREEFATGSRRDSREGKGRFDLLLMGMPEAVRRLAVLLERGAAKYGERNWERGQPISRYVDSAARHLHRAAQGLTDEDHLIQLAWNALAAAETLHRVNAGKLPAELNDVYESPDVEPK